VNLELPFDVSPELDLDTFIAKMDQELEALFLDEVAASLQRPAAEPPAAVDAA
jgi:hypothetical protein